MQLLCSDVVPGLGCDYVAHGDDAAEVHAAMVAHGAEVHSALMEGKTSEEMARAKEEMDDYILGLLSQD